MEINTEFRIDQEDFTRLMESLLAKLAEIIVEKIIGQVPKEKTGKSFISRKEFMKKYNLSSTTIYHRMQDGSLEFYKVGRRVFIREDSAFEKIQ